ncbi:MAG: helicase HerA-like domain-containing protein [Bacteroidia bacterium]
MNTQFIETVEKGYTFKGASITLGGAMIDGEVQTGTHVKVPLSTFNRHGLIAGATGTGKTKSLQVLAEQLSANSVPVVLMDIKGDLSGLAQASPGHRKIDERHAAIGMPFEAKAAPVELLSLSEEPGVRLRATVTEFGPVLFSKILGLNDTQSGIVAVIFKYCDDEKLPLIDLKDVKKTIQFITGEGKEAFQEEYGRVSTASTGAIIRKIIELEQQGAEIFFGEKSFEVDDLLRLDENGQGMISTVRLTDIQDRPKLFSTFMLSLLAEMYSTFPEEGDLDAPKLVMFIDEAHLIFEEASDALLDQLEAIIKLIRSKGVGIFFVTQNPADIPEDVLGQLGMKVQHSLRAFTAKDRKAIKLAAQNFPISDFYDVEDLLTSMGIGEAMVTGLNEKGIPTPLVHTMLRAPQSRMDILTKNEIEALIAQSTLIPRYNREVDRDSAYEILSEKIVEAQEEEAQEERKKEHAKAKKAVTRRRVKEPPTMLEELSKNTMVRQVGRTLAREVGRGLLGVLGLGGKSRKKSSWF